MIVIAPSNGTLRCTSDGGHTSLTDRIVKYIANKAAKNMSSEANQTITPTLTMLGRTIDPWSEGF